MYIYDNFELSKIVKKFSFKNDVSHVHTLSGM